MRRKPCGDGMNTLIPMDSSSIALPVEHRESARVQCDQSGTKPEVCK